jgi:hypothetical protein
MRDEEWGIEEKGRRQEAVFRNQGSYPDGFCPGGTDENSPVIDLWGQEKGRGLENTAGHDTH